MPVLYNVLPNISWFKINSSGTQNISYGNFDGPDGASGILLDLSGTGTLNSAEVTGSILKILEQVVEPMESMLNPMPLLRL